LPAPRQSTNIATLMTSAWDPDTYNRFREQRHQPFFDLLALVEPRAGMTAVDLGCGDGQLTAELHRRLGNAATLGVDSAETMLARAATLAIPALRFRRDDIATFTPTGPVDLVFSNAALHWLPDHPSQCARLTTFLRPGGQLAVQMPANHDHPSHRVAAAVAERAPFRAALGGYTGHHNVLPPERYAALLHSLGYTRQHVRLQVYAHVLPSRADVVEWVHGTTLTAFQARLPADLFAAYVAAYRDALYSELPDQRPFFYPFKRLLLWAARSS
jgi:trans-aconitate 2-methyltransferase